MDYSLLVAEVEGMISHPSHPPASVTTTSTTTTTSSSTSSSSSTSTKTSATSEPTSSKVDELNNNQQTQTRPIRRNPFHRLGERFKRLRRRLGPSSYSSTGPSTHTVTCHDLYYHELRSGRVCFLGDNGEFYIYIQIYTDYVNKYMYTQVSDKLLSHSNTM